MLGTEEEMFFDVAACSGKQGGCSGFQLFVSFKIQNHNIEVTDWVLSIKFFFYSLPHFVYFPDSLQSDANIQLYDVW